MKMQHPAEARSMEAGTQQDEGQEGPWEERCLEVQAGA